MHTLRVEKKLLLSLLYIVRWLGSEEDGGDQQMTPELLKAFSVKTTRPKPSKHHKELYDTLFLTMQMMYVADFVVRHMTTI